MASDASTDTLDFTVSSLAVESARANQIFAILVPYSPEQITSVRIIIHVDAISPKRIDDVYKCGRVCCAELSPPNKKELSVTVPLIRISTNFKAKCFNDEWSLFICRWPTDGKVVERAGENVPESLSVLGSMHFRGLMMSVGAHHWSGHHVTNVTWFRLDEEDLNDYSAHQHGALCGSVPFPACKITTVAVSEKEDHGATTQVGKLNMAFDDVLHYLGSSIGHGEGSVALVHGDPLLHGRIPVGRPYIALTAQYARLPVDVVANLHAHSHRQLAAAEASTTSPARRI
jgi:hypothetical protein